jgi:hypothetical protein
VYCESELRETNPVDNWKKGGLQHPIHMFFGLVMIEPKVETSFFLLLMWMISLSRFYRG